MNIYKFEVGVKTEWICACTIFEALIYYNSLNDLEIRDFSKDDDIIIIPETEWSEMNITNPDEKDKYGNLKVIETFAEYMKRQTAVDFIASKVY